jgi:hypothetical protein
MNNLKFEVGKAYRTRDGRKAVCLTTTLSDDDYPIGIQIDGSLYRATSDGYDYMTKSQSPKDIISEWVDKPVIDWATMPAWAKFVAMDDTGGWWWYGKKPFIGEINWRSESQYYDEIPKEYAPKWGGDWRNSLIERP